VKYQDLEYLISQPRLHKYLIVCANSEAKAQELYRTNLGIAQAFYPVLNLFEVVLRNIVHYRLSAHFTNPNWIITEKNGFMSDQTLSSSRFYLKNQVNKAESKLRRRRSTITSGKIIAEQTFGFWTSLFEPHHFRLIQGTIINSFPNKPASVNRGVICQKLQNIRDFRNRIYHNEPICFNGLNIDFQIAESIKIDVFDLLEWISDEAKEYVETYDNIDRKILIGKRI
jgi:hypothetical protein